MDDSDNSANLRRLTGAVVSAYVANNPLSPADLPQMLADVYAALAGLGTAAPTAVEQREPAVSIRKSVQPEAITCLECGKKFKSLKRHLMSSHELTPEKYRERWNLPRDYPMVAPAYSAVRSQLAKSNRLGRKPAAKAQSKKRS